MLFVALHCFILSALLVPVCMCLCLRERAKDDLYDRAGIRCHTRETTRRGWFMLLKVSVNIKSDH